MSWRGCPPSWSPAAGVLAQAPSVLDEGSPVLELDHVSCSSLPSVLARLACGTGMPPELPATPPQA